MVRIALALVVVLCSTRTTVADVAPPPERKIEDPRPWIIGSDMISTGVITGGAALAYAQRDCTSHGCGMGGFYMMLFGAMSYVSFPAFAHNDAGHRGRAFGSAALRVTLPLVGVAIAKAFERDAGTTLAVAGCGMVSAMLIDWLVLARAPARDGPMAPVWVYAAPVDGGAISGISGVF